MFSDPRKINILMTLINKHPKELVPLSAEMYDNYFSHATVPAEKVILDDRGNKSIVMVSKKKAIDHFKGKYMFVSRSDIAKVLEDERDNHNV